MSAPSFSSFPPSFSSFPDLDPGPNTQALTLSETSHDKSRKRERVKETRKKNKKRKHDEKMYEVEGSDLGHARRVDGFDARASEGSSFFYSDRKGDPMNVAYGRLHSNDVPRYNSVKWKVLGLGNALFALHRGVGVVEVGLRSTKQKMPALTDSHTRVLLTSAPARRLFGTSNIRVFEDVDEIPQIFSQKRNEIDQVYRSINDVHSDSGSSNSDSGSSDSDGPPISAHQEKLKVLEHKLATDPTDIVSWSSLLSCTLLSVPSDSKNALKARADITLSVLSRALSAHPDNRSSKALRLRYLKAGEEIWHENRLQIEWEDALQVGGIDMWMEWFEWRLRRASGGIDGVILDAQRILATLPSGEAGEMAKLRVFWRTVVALQSAGYVERCTAIFQAQAEFTFRLPQAYDGQPFEVQLDRLEQFWETENPRIGEPGAIGWAAWISSDQTSHSHPPSMSASLGSELQNSILDPYTRWATTEIHSDRVLSLPMRSMDVNDGDSDPYAIIFFSDIRPMLLSLQSPRAKSILRLIWLSVLGLHIPGLSTSLDATLHENADDRWADMHLVSPVFLSRIFPPCEAQTRSSSVAHAGVLIGRELEYARGFAPVRSWSSGVVNALECWDGETAGLWTKDNLENLGSNVSLAKRLFEQLRMGNDDVEWDILTLAFEAALNMKSAHKLSRSFLSAARESLPHWRCHAQLERLRGRPDEARKVYNAVLVVSPAPAIAPAVPLLWWDWAEMEWLEGKLDAVIRVVLKSAGVEGTSGVAILRAKRRLEDAYLLTDSGPWKEREAWVKLRALLELLTSSVTSALGVYDERVGGGDELRSVVDESLMVASLLMLYRHGTVLKNPLPPSLLRERVEKAMARYPNNTIVLGLFLHAEKGQGVWGKVRAILGDTQAPAGGREIPEKNVARRAAEVWIAGWERGRWEAEVERTRNGLSAAMQNDRTKGSTTLWRLFVEFEIRVGQFQRAKNVLFRAIGECPLYKELYLLAFGPLRKVFEPRELKTFAETMAERQIRMRSGLDFVLESLEDGKRNEEELSGEESEIERDARELRRLMPY